MNITPPFCNGQNRCYDAVNSIYDKLTIDNATMLSTNYFDCHFALTQTQHDTLTELVKPRHVRYVGVKNSTHPILASLNAYAYKKFNAIAAMYKSKYNMCSIDIGGTPTKTNQSTHICAKRTTDRECFRYNMAYLRSGNIAYTQQYYKHKQILGCHLGAEHCHIKAPYAFSVNANYDIDIRTIAIFFAKHQLITYDVAMFLPAILADKRTNIPTTYYKCNLFNDKVRFSLGDMSFIYEHDYQIWSEYLKTTVLDVGIFKIIIEIEENIGDFYFLKMNRVENIPIRIKSYLNGLIQNIQPMINESITRLYSRSAIYGEYYLVPDLILYMEHRWCHNVINKHMLLINKTYADTILRWANGAQDDQYKYNSFSSWCRANSSALIYDPKNMNLMVTAGYNNSIDVYERMMQNLFLVTALQRLQRTSDISKAFNYIKKCHKKSAIKKIIEEKLHKIAEYKPINNIIQQLTLSTTKASNVISYYNLLNARILPIDDLFYNQTIDCIHLKESKCDFDISNNYIEECIDELIKEEKNSNYNRDEKIVANIELNENKINYEISKIDKEITNKTNDNHNCQHKVFKHGQCALEALNDYLRNENMKTEINFKYEQSKVHEFLEKCQEKVTIQGTTTSIRTIDKLSLKRIYRGLHEDTTWFTDVELAFLCSINTLNLRIIGASFQHEFDNNSNKIFNVNYVEGHWFYRRTGGYNNFGVAKNKLTLAKETKNFNPDNNTVVNMKEKMADLYQFLIDHVAIRNSTTIIDLTTAPGYFSNHAYQLNNTVRCYTWNGPNSLKMSPHFKYLKVNEYQKLSEIKENVVKKENDPIIFDHFIRYFYDQGKDIPILNKAKYVLTKFDPYNQDDLDVINLLNRNKIIMTSDHTRIDSGETYVLLVKKTKNDIVDLPFKQDIDLTLVTQISQDKRDLSRPLNLLSALFEDKMTIKQKVNYKDNNIYNLLPQNYKLESYDIPLLNGVGGADKTSSILKVKNNKTFIISPILNERLISYTIFLKNFKEYKPKMDALIIDEVYAMSTDTLSYIAAVCSYHNIELFVFGDPFQIHTYEKHNCDYNYTNDHYKLVSKRILPEVAVMLQKYIPGIKTINKTKGLIKTNDEKKFNDDDMHICFSKKFKTENTRKGFKIITAHESQSLTIPNVVVHCKDITTIEQRERIKYLYVAISRASNRLILYGDSSELQIFESILNTPIENATSMSNNPTNDTTIIKTIKTTIDPAVERIEVDKSKIDSSNIDQILCRTIARCNPIAQDVAIQAKILPPISTRMKISNEHFAAIDVESKGYALSNQSFTREDHSKDQFKTLQTLIKRYSKEVKQKEHSEKLYKGLFKFINEEKFTLHKTTLDDLRYHTNEYLIQLQKKVNNGDDPFYKAWSTLAVEKNEDYNKTMDDNCEKFLQQFNTKIKAKQDLEKEWFETSTQLVGFIMKKQHKHLIEHGKDNQFKAGQGVASWTKIVNVLLSGYCRCLQEKVCLSVNDNVLIAYNRSDLELSVFFEKYGPEFGNKKFKNGDNDFTEMDTTHGESMLKLEITLFNTVNMPSNLKELYHKVRSSWTLQYMSRNGSTTLKNKFCQHSGQPLTLCSNTLLNMAAVGAFIKFGEILYIAFKGDDMTSRSTKLVEKKIGKLIASSYYGYQFKLKEQVVSEFIANIITPHGFFPDVLRRVTKNLCKRYENAEQWEESRVNILESIKCVRNNMHFVTGMNLSKLHYETTDICISVPEIEYIYNYLNQLSTTKYHQIEKLPLLNRTLHYADVIKIANSN